MPTRQELLSAAERLHAHLLRRHYDHGLLRGPDAGVRLNLRAWRFLKSALDFLPWRDDYVFMQTQGYWILANWMLHEATGEGRYRELALESTEAALRLERPEGFWAYPLPERKHLIATIEGNWGAIGLLASYARHPRQEFLGGAIRWYDFLAGRIGFQSHPCGKAVNYFDRPRGKVPNNSTATVWFLLRLWKASGDNRFLEHVAGLLDFVGAVQLPSGELPYVVESSHERRREHYLCFQYNAFQFLNLASSVELELGERVRPILTKLAQFLVQGVGPSGACAVDCSHIGGGGPEVDYYAAVLAAALLAGNRLGWLESRALSERCYARVLARQRPDGSFTYSTGDYGLLRDQRSYPRPQAMTLYHLLYPFCGDGFPKDAQNPPPKVGG
jgi:hypothetical protein